MKTEVVSQNIDKISSTSKLVSRNSFPVAFLLILHNSSCCSNHKPSMAKKSKQFQLANICFCHGIAIA